MCRRGVSVQGSSATGPAGGPSSGFRASPRRGEAPTFPCPPPCVLSAQLLALLQPLRPPFGPPGQLLPGLPAWTPALPAAGLGSGATVPRAIPVCAGQLHKPPASACHPHSTPCFVFWGSDPRRSPGLWFSIPLRRSPHSGEAGTRLSAPGPRGCQGAWERRSSGPVCGAGERRSPRGSRSWGGRHAAVGNPESRNPQSSLPSQL